MKKKRRVLTLLAVMTPILFTLGTATASEQGHAIKVGKTGEVTFATQTMVGDFTLKPGRYKFQHRVEGGEHFVHFTQWTTQRVISDAPKAHPGEMKCRLETLNKKVDRTAVYTIKGGDGQRLTRIVVAGENVAHVF